MTDPKILAELRELLGKATPDKLSLDGDVIEGPYQVAKFFMYPHARDECEADRRLFLLLRNHAATLLADSERLRIAVGGLGKLIAVSPEKGICDEYEQGFNNAIRLVSVIASDTLAKIKENKCGT